MSKKTYRIIANGKDTGQTVSDERQVMKVSALLDDAYHESDVLSFNMKDVREGVYDNISIDDQQLIVNCKIAVKERIFNEKPKFVFNTYIKDYDELSERDNFYLQAGDKKLKLNGNGEFVFVGNEMSLDWKICYKGKYHWDCSYKNHVIIITDHQDSEQIRIVRVDNHNKKEYLCDDAFVLHFTINSPKSIDSHIITYISTDHGELQYTLIFKPIVDRKEWYEAFLVLSEEYININVDKISFCSIKYKYKTINLNGRLKKNVSIPVEMIGRRIFVNQNKVVWLKRLLYLLTLFICMIFAISQINDYKRSCAYWQGRYESEYNRANELSDLTDTLASALGVVSLEWPGWCRVKAEKGYKKEFKIYNISALKGDTIEFDYKNSCATPGKLNVIFEGKGESFNITSDKEQGHAYFIIPYIGSYNIYFSYLTDACDSHDITINHIRLKRNRVFMRHFNNLNSEQNKEKESITMQQESKSRKGKYND